MKGPLENRHHHSFTKNYEKAVNGCQKYFHIKLPEGALLATSNQAHTWPLWWCVFKALFGVFFNTLIIF